MIQELLTCGFSLCLEPSETPFKVLHPETLDGKPKPFLAGVLHLDIDFSFVGQGNDRRAHEVREKNTMKTAGNQATDRRCVLQEVSNRSGRMSFNTIEVRLTELRSEQLHEVIDDQTVDSVAGED